MRLDKDQASISYNEMCYPDPASKCQLLYDLMLQAYCAATHIGMHRKRHTESHTPQMPRQYTCCPSIHTLEIHLFTHSVQFVADLYLKLALCVWPTQRDRYYHRGMSSSPQGAARLLSTSLSFSFFLFQSLSLSDTPPFSLPLQLFLTPSHLQA